ncbi:hypothetical protein [Rhodoplanes roseus]|uniref:TonB C-terminal domain-containing protein n=1 Tax=Rhodoplanes roseus TaxID=29409 RepID=A0A327L8P1_9BRAD|nr:hypothetical protein [Rhodoplanes roseus]RAI44058.1 hypothetical protein CH341_11025 [Rhodoplanes roseus]
MRLALAISVIVHAVLWGLAGLQMRAPLAAVTPSMEVELVRPDEVPEPPKQDTAKQDATKQDATKQDAPKEEPAKEETAKQEPPAPPERPTETAAAQPPQPEPPTPQSAPQPSAPERPSEPDPVDQTAAVAAQPRALPSAPQLAMAAPAEDDSEPAGSGSWFDSPLMNIPVGYQTTDRKAKLTEGEIAAFRAHLRTCWQPSAALADAPAKLNVVLRVALKPNGALAAEPTLLAASASAKGAVLMQTAMAALTRCQAIGVLPAAKYKEWKLLDLAFSPSGLTGLPKL